MNMKARSLVVIIGRGFDMDLGYCLTHQLLTPTLSWVGFSTASVCLFVCTQHS